MSVTVDANVLIYASDVSSSRHDRCRALLTTLSAGPDLLYVFWPVAMAYLRISTHPRIFASPLDPSTALDNLDRLLGRANVRSPGEGERFWAVFRQTVAPVRRKGNAVTDSHIAALMRHHGVRAIWTSDRDFRRFDGVTALDPDDWQP